MKAKELIFILEKNPDLDLGFVTITHYCGGGGEVNDEKRATMIGFAKMFGEFKKEVSGSSVSLTRYDHNQNLMVQIYGYDTCKIVGHRVEKRKKMVPPPGVEVIMVETEEEIKIPVSDCEIKAGDVKADEVVFN